jgi:hypothetical protein
MSWNVQRQDYGYIVDGIFHHSKINALQAASGDISRLKLYFHDDNWRHVDWTSEPSESWQSLVDRKCHQLRNKYQTLTLFFSGGYDSITILNGFIRNNLKIEELIIWERPWLLHLKSEVNYALELAKQIKQQHSQEMTALEAESQAYADLRKHGLDQAQAEEQRAHDAAMQAQQQLAQAVQQLQQPTGAQ